MGGIDGIVGMVMRIVRSGSTMCLAGTRMSILGTWMVVVAGRGSGAEDAITAGAGGAVGVCAKASAGATPRIARPSAASANATAPAARSESLVPLRGPASSSRSMRSEIVRRVEKGARRDGGAAGPGRRFGDFGERARVGANLTARLQNPVVAGQLALEFHPVRDQRDCRVEEEHCLREPLQGVRVVVAPPQVGEFVECDPIEFFRSQEREEAARDQDDGVEDSGRDGDVDRLRSAQARASPTARDAIPVRQTFAHRRRQGQCVAFETFELRKREREANAEHRDGSEPKSDGDESKGARDEKP